MNRELDGCYFRVERNGRYQNICFSDLSESEMNDVLKGRNEEWLQSLCVHLGQTIRTIGDQFDICRNDEDDEYTE